VYVPSLAHQWLQFTSTSITRHWLEMNTDVISAGATHGTLIVQLRGVGHTDFMIYSVRLVLIPVILDHEPCMTKMVYI
jgi:hypothetical protein